MTKLRIDAYRTANGMVAWRTHQAIKPGKAPGLDQCSHELLKTMSDEEFLIIEY